jgi:hypothetical protein
VSEGLLTPLALALGTLAALRTEHDTARAEVARVRAAKQPDADAVAERDRVAEALRKAEDRAIVEALAETGGNRPAAAKLVGMSRRTAYRRAPEHALPPPPRPHRDAKALVDLVLKVGFDAAAAQLGLAPRYVQAVVRKYVRAEKARMRRKA